jgi:hypothetical protein
MSKYIQKVEKCSFLISRSVKCVTRTTKVDNSLASCFGLMTHSAVVVSALVDAALRKSGLISNGKE